MDQTFEWFANGALPSRCGGASWIDNGRLMSTADQWTAPIIPILAPNESIPTGLRNLFYVTSSNDRLLLTHSWKTIRSLEKWESWISFPKILSAQEIVTGILFPRNPYLALQDTLIEARRLFQPPPPSYYFLSNNILIRVQLVRAKRNRICHKSSDRESGCGFPISSGSLSEMVRFFILRVSQSNVHIPVAVTRYGGGQRRNRSNPIAE